MPEYELVLEKDGREAGRYPLVPAGIVIGRSPDVDVVLTGQMVSRRHARVWLEEGVARAEDLGSRNGISVNGRRVVSSELLAGDHLMVGDISFRLEHALKIPSGSSFISFEKAGRLAEEMVQKEGGAALPLLYKAAKLLGTVFDLDDLLRQILKLIFEALPVRRSYILTLSPETNEPVIHATLSRETDGSEGPPLSLTLIRHVFKERSAVLTLDAMDDSRFDASQSIMKYSIHGAMCAPLFGREAIVGAIYVDAGTQEVIFTKDNLELFTAISWVVGIAVENARLYQENVDRERLVAIGKATAGVGHCVKNILTGIMGGAQFIDMAIERKDITYLEKGWPIMSRSIERIENLVLNMLSFSRDHTPEFAPMDVNGLVNEVTETVRSRAEKGNVTLTFNQEDIGVVCADSREIYRVLLNLVTNALDACERKGGTVSVSTSAKPEGCCIEVSDTGVGIPAEVLPRLFQAFFTTKGSRGTGLGLACSYKIVREHHGTITVKSEPGQGTSFTVFLPRQGSTGPPRSHVGQTQTA
jgi:signal transduction histidine kinase